MLIKTVESSSVLLAWQAQTRLFLTGRSHVKGNHILSMLRKLFLAVALTGNFHVKTASMGELNMDIRQPRDQTRFWHQGYGAYILGREIPRRFDARA